MAVAVVNLNTRDHLHACLDSIVAGTPAEVILVDNASVDGSVETVRAAYRDVTIIANAENRGYAAAANQAIAASTAPHVLLLNADTRLRPGAIDALTAHLDQNPDAAIVGPRLVNPDGVQQPSCFDFRGPRHMFFELTFFGRLARFVPGLRSAYHPAYWPDGPGRMPWVLGAALAMRRDALASVGGFDESFFLYYEEVDLCYRLAAAGWEVHFTPLAEVIHVGGASSRQRPAETEAQLRAATRQFYRTHYSPSARRILKALMTYRLIVDIGRDSARLAAAGRTRDRAEIERRLDGWRRELKATWRG
jgi:hypothetical protein